MTYGTWQPMETAPKDGHFLAFDGREVLMVERNHVNRHGFSVSNSGCGVRPTHWMPLPPLPGADKKEGK